MKLKCQGKIEYENLRKEFVTKLKGLGFNCSTIGQTVHLSAEGDLKHLNQAVRLFEKLKKHDIDLHK